MDDRYRCPCAVRRKGKWEQCAGEACVFRADMDMRVCQNHARRWQGPWLLWNDVKRRIEKEAS